MEEFSDSHRVAALDLRNANGGESEGPLDIERTWDAFTDDQLALADHLDFDRFMVLVLPDDIPAHPYATAMETALLAPNAQVSLYPWKENDRKIGLAVQHIRTFLRANSPVAG